MRVSLRCLWLALLLAAMSSSSIARGQSPRNELQILAWNIWNGGDEARYVEDEPAKRAKQQAIVDVIKASGADVVAMVETYGSGEAIAAGLGFHFHPRGTNVSILSRWPVVEDVSIYKPFNCVGAIVELPGKRRVAEILAELSALTVEIAVELDKARSMLRAFAGKPGAPRASLDDVRAQIDHLASPELLLSAPRDRLSQVPRYLKAIQVRLDRLPNGPQKDQSKAKVLLQIRHLRNHRDNLYLNLDSTVACHQDLK